MAGEPKKKHSKARKRTRRASISLIPKNTIICKNCGELTIPHLVCKNCGFYKGKQVNAKTEVKIVKA